VIVVAGEALIDLIVRPAGDVVAVPGGGPYNTARTIGRLDGDVAFLGRLSSDGFGRLLRDRLTADGVDVGLSVPTDDPTTLALAELDTTGTAAYRFYLEGTSAPGLTPADLPAELPVSLVAVHVGTLGLLLEPIAPTLESWLGTLPDAVLVMVDVNARPGATGDSDAYRARMMRILAHADVVKASTEDLAFLRPGAEPAIAAHDILTHGAAAVLITDGGRSVQVATAEGTTELPVPKVVVVDTVGAGDAFGGGFLAEWIAQGRGREELRDHDALAQAAAFAIRVAVITVQRPGADPPTRSEVEALEVGPA
jgi:fructokinase